MRSGPRIIGVLVLGCACARAETPPEWVAGHSGGGSGLDAGLAIRVSAAGQRYATGYFSSEARFGDARLQSAGNTDVFVRGYGRADQPRWLVGAGGAGADRGTGLALDASGNACVTGYFTSTATFHSTDGSALDASGSGETIFIASYTPSGVLRWLRTGVASGGVNRGFGVAVDSASGACYVTGIAQGDLDFSSGDGLGHVVNGNAYWHMFLVAYDSLGNFRWGETNSATPNSQADAVAVGADGVYTAGWFESTTTFSSADGHALTVRGLSRPVQTSPSYPGDAFLAKYDLDGNLQWVDHIGGYKAVITDVATSVQGLVSVTGFIGNIDGTESQRHTIATSQPGGSRFDLGGGIYTDPSDAYRNRDAFVATYDSDGALRDARRLETVGEEQGTGIAYDCAGNLYVAGAFQQQLSIDGTDLAGTHANNLFVLKFDAAGSLVWARDAGGAGTANWQAGYPRLTITPWNNVLLIGGFRASAHFDAMERSSRGATDLFVGRLLQTAPPPPGC